MSANFDELVRSLDAGALEELKRSVAAVAAERRAQTAVQIEQIHPRMTAEARAAAIQEIARVLRGDDAHA